MKICHEVLLKCFNSEYIDITVKPVCKHLYIELNTWDNINTGLHRQMLFVHRWSLYTGGLCTSWVVFVRGFDLLCIEVMCLNVI